MLESTGRRIPYNTGDMKPPIIPPVVNDPKRLARTLFRKPAAKPRPKRPVRQAQDPAVTRVRDARG